MLKRLTAAVLMALAAIAAVAAPASAAVGMRPSLTANDCAYTRTHTCASHARAYVRPRYHAHSCGYCCRCARGGLLTLTILRIAL